MYHRVGCVNIGNASRFSMSFQTNKVKFPPQPFHIGKLVFFVATYLLLPRSIR